MISFNYILFQTKSDDKLEKRKARFGVVTGTGSSSDVEVRNVVLKYLIVYLLLGSVSMFEFNNLDF